MSQNVEVPWECFDAAWYFDCWYGNHQVRGDERAVITEVRDFFAQFDLGHKARGIDVGPGPNLYPTLLLSGICREVTLFEFSASNRAWLRKELQAPSPSWHAYWDVLAESDRYREAGAPWNDLAERAKILKGSVFSPTEERWDAGTMFYVAESITSDTEEFHRALSGFLDRLNPGAPFAIAFMENSLGYSVGGAVYPAVRVDVESVEAALQPVAKEFQVKRAGIVGEPGRDGYSGLIVALGRASA